MTKNVGATTNVIAKLSVHCWSNFLSQTGHKYGNKIPTKYQQSSINTALSKVDSTLFKVDNQLCFLRKLDIIHSSSRLAMPFAKLFGNILLKGVYFLASYKLCGFLGSDFVGNWFVDLHRKQILYFIIRVCGRKLAVKSRVRISRTLNILRFIRRRIKLWYTVTVAYWY